MIALLLVFLHCGRAAAEPITLEHADIFRNVPVGTVELQELQGNVRVLHKGMVIDFHFGRYNRQNGVLHCITDVVVTQEGDTLTADEITFYEKDERTVARGHVVYRGDSLLATGREAIWKRGLEQGEMSGEVRITDFKAGLVLDCDRAQLDNASGRARADRSPVLTQLEGGEQSAVLRARVLEVFRGQEEALAWQEVELEREGLVATCDSLRFLQAEGLARLFIDPRIVQEDREISGLEMEIWSREQQLDSLKVHGQALVLSPADSVSASLMDRLEGDELQIHFREGQPERILVEGSALAVSFLRDDAGEAGMNLARAPRMEFRLQEGELEELSMGGGVRAWWIPLLEPRKPASLESREAPPAVPSTPQDTPEEGAP